MINPGQNLQPTGKVINPGQTLQPTGTLINPGQTLQPTGKVINPGQTLQPTGTLINSGQTLQPTGKVINPGQTLQPTGTIINSGQTLNIEVFILYLVLRRVDSIFIPTICNKWQFKKIKNVEEIDVLLVTPNTLLLCHCVLKMKKIPLYS